MKRHFTAEELEEMIYSGDEERKYFDNRRWSRTVESIVEVDNKFYRVNWEEGLTESQENEFYDGEYPEVKKHEGVNAKRFTKWINVDEDVTVDYEKDVNSMLLVTDEEKVENAIKALDELNIDSVLSSLNALEALNINETLTVENIVVNQYFQNLIKLKETIKNAK